MVCSFRLLYMKWCACSSGLYAELQIAFSKNKFQCAEPFCRNINVSAVQQSVITTSSMNMQKKLNKHISFYGFLLDAAIMHRAAARVGSVAIHPNLQLQPQRFAILHTSVLFQPQSNELLTSLAYFSENYINVYRLYAV